jgi:uncharacterized protein (DUF697 family)
MMQETPTSNKQTKTKEKMTETQRKKCKNIIHSWSAVAGTGNLLPVPGTGFVADTAALAMMARELAGVFGEDKSASAAKGIAVATFRRVLLKQPIRAIGKELCKLIPFAGQALSAGISVGIAEATGWSMANDFDKRKAAA